MDNVERKTRKKTRIDNEQFTEMKRLFREGKSISAIAREIGCHRQTVRMHLQEKRGDIIADEVRKQVLSEELRNHFKQLIKFAQTDLKLCLDASTAQHEKQTRGETRSTGPIILRGRLGLPDSGSAIFMNAEWVRLYRLSPQWNHLFNALREHTKELPLWVLWDDWQRMVAKYKSTSRVILGEIDQSVEFNLSEEINQAYMETIIRWLFGNCLRTVSGLKAEILEVTEEGLVSSDDIATSSKGIYARMYVVRTSDEANKQYLLEHLIALEGELRKKSEYFSLIRLTSDLLKKDKQLELRHIAEQLDYALASIELMGALPGHCALCPI